MADYVTLSGGDHEGEAGADPKPKPSRAPRLASLDAFRGVSIALMIFVDYAGSIFPIVAHSPWNGVRLADFVMPFFLFIAGVSLSLVYKRIYNKFQATQKVISRAVKLFLLGVLLQGGYLHGINTLTFGVDIEKVRWLGILQRIAIGYLIAALCEIWLSSKTKNTRGGVFKNYFLHWVVILLVSGIYLGLLYGLYVPDWQFRVQETSLNSSIDDGYVLKTVKCGVRGDLGPACNSAGMIDRLVLGIEHLYKKPVYRNLKECAASQDGQVLDTLPSWCQAPFDPEGILGRTELALLLPLLPKRLSHFVHASCVKSLMAAVTCIIGLQYGHILVHFEDHKDRLVRWLWLSLSIFVLGLLLSFIGIPLNKSLYTTSYTLLTTGSAGFTFSALYLLDHLRMVFSKFTKSDMMTIYFTFIVTTLFLWRQPSIAMVDVYGHKWTTFVFEHMGRHSLSIFIIVPSNVAIILIQGFYWRSPNNNLVHWIVSFFVHK